MSTSRIISTLVFVSLAGCDSSDAAPAKADDKKADDKKADKKAPANAKAEAKPAGKPTEAKPAEAKAAEAKPATPEPVAPPAPAADDASVIAAGRELAMTACHKAAKEFAAGDRKSYETLVGALAHPRYNDPGKKSGVREFVGKKAVVRKVFGTETTIYIATDDVDPCTMPIDNLNSGTGPVPMTEAGNEVISVAFNGTAAGSYIGRSIDEAMADLMGGPPNWVGVSYVAKDPDIKDYKAGDANTPYAFVNSDGRSYLEITKYEAGKVVEGEVHACLGVGPDAQHFLIGPIKAEFCPDAVPPAVPAPTP